jgi:hypothetical protein
MAEATQTQAGVVAAYEKIAQEILDRPESVPSAIHNLLLKLAETHPGAVYWIVRKFYQEYLRLYVSDTGYIGIADRYEPGVMFPGDIALYMLPESLKSGDVVQVTFTDKNDVSVYVVHGRVSDFNQDGSVKVEDIRTGEEYSVVEWNILGRLIKTVSFGSDEWEELFSVSSVPKDWIATSIEENIDSIRRSEIPEKEAVLSELKNRLAQLV